MKIRNALLLIGGIVLGVLVLVGVFRSAGNNGDQSTPIAIPEVSLEDYEGNLVTISDFTGQPLVLNSWAVWCPFCVKELSDFIVVQQEFRDQVNIIAINRAESRDVAKEFTDSIGVTDQLLFVLDPEDTFYRAIGGFSMPETLFVRADGTVQYHKRGPMSVDEIRQRTQALIQSQ